MKFIPLLELQYFQELHDKRYHVDIYAKPLMGRLSHLVNHLNKYAASDLRRQSSYEDALACILSMANALNLNLADAISDTTQQIVMNLSEVPRQYHKSVLLNRYRIALANMTKLVEGFDHVETLEYREDFKAAIVEALIVLSQIREDIDELSLDIWTLEYIIKLFELKRKSIFYAMYHEQDLKDVKYQSFVTMLFISKETK